MVVPADSPIALPGRTRPAAAPAMASFSARSRTDLASKPGSSALVRPGARGAAVHLVDQPLAGERLEVAADRHVGHVERLEQVADPHPAALADPLEDGGLPLPARARQATSLANDGDAAGGHRDRAGAGRAGEQVGAGRGDRRRLGRCG